MAFDLTRSKSFRKGWNSDVSPGEACGAQNERGASFAVAVSIPYVSGGRSAI